MVNLSLESDDPHPDLLIRRSIVARGYVITHVIRLTSSHQADILSSHVIIRRVSTVQEGIWKEREATCT